MKKNIISFLLSFCVIINPVFAEHSVVTDASLTLTSEKQDDSFVIQHKDVEITVGDLKIKAPFLYQGESTPKQGYIISIRDTIRLKDIVEGCQSSCNILTDALVKSCNDKLNNCQKNCDERIKSITKENNNLRKKIKVSEENFQKEKTQKYVWSIMATVAGAGFGILTYQLSK